MKLTKNDTAFIARAASLVEALFDFEGHTCVEFQNLHGLSKTQVRRTAERLLGLCQAADRLEIETRPPKNRKNRFVFENKKHSPTAMVFETLINLNDQPARVKKMDLEQMKAFVSRIGRDENIRSVRLKVVQRPGKKPKQ